MIITVYDNQSKEILAIIDTTGKTESVCRDDINFCVYNDTEPIIKTTMDGKAYLDEARFIIKWDKEQKE